MLYCELTEPEKISNGRWQEVHLRLVKKSYRLEINNSPVKWQN